MSSYYKEGDSAGSYKAIKALMAVFAWLGLYYGFFYIGRQVSFANYFRGPSMALVLSAVVCSLATIGVLSLLVQRKFTGLTLPCLLIICIAADVALNHSIIFYQAKKPDVESISTPEKEKRDYSGNDALLHHLAAINLSLLGIALCGGLLVSGSIKKTSYLIPLSVIAGIADCWSVFAGVTKQIAASRVATNYVLVNFPVSGQGIQPLIGAVDFLFSAMYLDLSRRFNLSMKRTILVLITSFLASIILATFIGTGLPVLPVMAVLFITAHYDRIRIVDPREKREAVIGATIVVGILTAASFLLKLFGH